jgi:ketosteroid isomerase-like protein
MDKVESYKLEIIAVEEAFAKRVAEMGLADAFEFYAADDAVLLRGKQLYLGKSAISNLYKQSNSETDIKLTWKVEFVDVSSAGDLAYTYGEYLYTSTNQDGKSEQDRGIFHTVWKRQANGEWRFVWD